MGVGVKIVTAKDVSWPCTVAILSDGTEIPKIRRIDFRHGCDELAVATIEVICDGIEVDAVGELTTMFMGKKYTLVEIDKQRIEEVECRDFRCLG